jgi:hypothetical protein
MGKLLISVTNEQENLVRAYASKNGHTVSWVIGMLIEKLNEPAQTPRTVATPSVPTVATRQFKPAPKRQ